VAIRAEELLEDYFGNIVEDIEDIRKKFSEHLQMLLGND
jgi:hypothetical protein